MTNQQLEYLKLQELMRANQVQESLKRLDTEANVRNITEQLDSQIALREAQIQKTLTDVALADSQELGNVLRAVTASDLVDDSAITLAFLSDYLGLTEDATRTAMIGTTALQAPATALKYALELQKQAGQNALAPLDWLNKVQDQAADFLNPIGEIVSGLLGSDLNATKILDVIF